MNFNMNMRKFLLTSAVAFSAASAFAADNQAEVVTQQKSLLEKLDSLNAAVLGLKINGTAKAGIAASFASSDQFASESPTQENQAFTDVNLRLTARPSSETMIDVQLRLHKDWQNAYDENNNPIIGHWFSYDGTILNKHVDFNLGYMRVGYTPLTIYTPQTEILQEPEILAEKRREALAQRNLDTTSRRLLQGLNVVYNSGNVSVLDNITAQLTGARLRNTAKKIDQVFFDFDFADRYLLGARVGADAYGAHLGVNFVNLMDRKQTRRSRPISDADTIYYDNNMVISADVAFDSKKLLPELPVTFGLTGEFAMSKWKVDRDYNVKENQTSYNAMAGKEDGKSFVYLKPVTKAVTTYTNEDYADVDGKSFYADLFVKGNISDIDFKVDAGYFQTDSGFWSELASTPVYMGRSTIFNGNALYGNPADSLVLATFGASSLENLYFSVYNSTTLQATNLMTSGGSNSLSADAGESSYMYSRLDNNYKNGHFYRNGYTSNTYKKLEMLSLKPFMDIDPSVSLALPLGKATPDRKGITAKADVNWADKVTFNARVNMVTQSNLIGYDPVTFAPISTENKFTEFAAGLGVDAGALAGLDRQILLQGSYSHGEEDSYLKRKADRIVAGFTADVWGPIALLGGFQMYTKEFGNGYAVAAAAVTKATEMLALGGARVKLAPLSYVSLQGGLLKNELEYSVIGVPAVNKISISKLVLLADVTVNF
ncbi:MAG: hypothetical protein J6P15_00060 [Fibrobacter sp.]|nr:hypothetical protein [Fibrobacter sp.]